MTVSQVLSVFENVFKTQASHTSSSTVQNERTAPCMLKHCICSIDLGFVSGEAHQWRGVWVLRRTNRLPGANDTPV